MLTRASNVLAAPLRSLRGGLPWPRAISFAAALSNTADSSRGGPLGKVASGEDDGESDATRSGDAAQGSRVPMVDDLRWRWQVGSRGEQGPQARDTMGSPQPAKGADRSAPARAPLLRLHKSRIKDRPAPCSHLPRTIHGAPRTEPPYCAAQSAMLQVARST